MPNAEHNRTIQIKHLEGKRAGTVTPYRITVRCAESDKALTQELLEMFWPVGSTHSHYLFGRIQVVAI